MGRPPREISPAGLYHITLRGNNKGLLFETEDDRRSFMLRAIEDFGSRNIELIAWCLMSNHVHLIVSDLENHRGSAIHALTVSYAARFNRIYGRSGHVFQGRYGSSAICDEPYLLEAIRYVHDNPQKAGICPRDSYLWSSHRQYLGILDEYSFIDSEVTCRYFDSATSYAKFMACSSTKPYRPSGTRLTEEEAMRLARDVCANLGGCSTSDVAGLPKPLRDEILVELKAVGLSIRQIQMTTRVGEWSIRRAANCDQATHKP